jgi:catechol 2,3-dioxygenase-like lactoylglutathione lyase family enzyme
MELEGRACGFACDGKLWFWIHQGEPGGGVHVAFAAEDTATVDASHAAALAAGGTDNGPPGIREHYHPTHSCAFVHDPDGNNVEAVFHDR